MPRQARKESRSNIYHVMLRGINRQVIFEDNQDRYYFMTVLKKYREVSLFNLHAFCLMPNHVHLLIEPTEEPLETIFKRIGVSYAGWYNKKYERVGHLFQDRFRSENVETDQYYMTALRYIIQNPVKAGIVDHPGKYPWSSYRAYEIGKGSLTDTQYALNLFGSRENLVSFLTQAHDDIVMDEEQFDKRLRGDLEKEIMLRITRCDSVAAFQQLDRSLQEEYICELYQEQLSGAHIAALTGVPRSSVYRIIKASRPIPDADSQHYNLREPEISEFEFNINEVW